MIKKAEIKIYLESTKRKKEEEKDKEEEETYGIMYMECTYHV